MNETTTDIWGDPVKKKEKARQEILHVDAVVIEGSSQELLLPHSEPVKSPDTLHAKISKKEILLWVLVVLAFTCGLALLIFAAATFANII